MATGICTRIDSETGKVTWVKPDQTLMSHGNHFWLTLLTLSGVLAAPLLSHFQDLAAMYLCLPLLLVPPLLVPFHQRLRQSSLPETQRAELWRKGLHTAMRLTAVSMIAMYGGWLVSLAAVKVAGLTGWALCFAGVFWLRQRSHNLTFDF